jgi:dienelactone hydrolase
MVPIVLFHSILGLRAAERDLASAFEADGHSVALPDLYEGEATNDYDEGFRIKDTIGMAQIMDRARAALADAPEDAVLAGVSFGAFLIGQLWGDRSRTRGALFFAGGGEWPTCFHSGLPVQAHIARPDPFEDEEYLAEWAGSNPGFALELYRYDGGGHYFLDRNLPDFKADAAELCLERSRKFLNRL